MNDENPLLPNGKLILSGEPLPQHGGSESNDENPLLPGGRLVLSGEPGPPIDTMSDIGQTLVAKGTRGFASLPGMFGDVPAMLGATTYRPPTTEEYINKLSSLSPEIQKALSYEPKTTAARYIGSAAEFAPSAFTALIPGVGEATMANAARSLIGAAGAGVGSEAASDALKASMPALKGTGYEGAARLAGSVAGGLAAPTLGGKIANIFNPENAALQRMAKAGASDIATSTASSPIGTSAAQEVAPIAAGGVQTQQLVKNAAQKAGESNIGAFNDAAQDFKNNSIDMIHDKIDSLFGEKVQPFEEKDILSQRAKDVNSVNYPKVMSLPEAQAIQSPDIQSLIKRLPRNTVSDVLEQARIQGIDPESAFGLVKTSSGYAVPSSGANLKFWDEIKQNLDSQIGSYIDPVTKVVKPGSANIVSNLQGLKSDLVSTLDNAVPDYQNIRFEASNIYGARNAIEAGYKYFNDTNSQNLKNIEKLVQQKLTDPQKEQFAYGFAGAYKDAIAKDPQSALGVYTGKKSAFNTDKLKFAIGEDAANDLLGTVNSQYLNSSIKTLTGNPQASGIGSGTGATSLLAGVSAFLGPNLPNLLDLSAAAALGSSGTAFGVAAAAGASKALYNFHERNVANQILKLAVDPANNAKLGRLIDNNQYAKSFLAKFYKATQLAPPVAAQTQDDQQSPRALTIQGPGNRIGRKSGGRVSDKLVAAADSAKKNINSNTESLLNVPDTHVAQALELANKYL